MNLLQSNLKTLEDKLNAVGGLVARLRSENASLKIRIKELEQEVEQNKSIITEQLSLNDTEGFSAKVMLAKKIKREVEQTLRDAERKLELLRF